MKSSLLSKLEFRLFGPPQVSRNGVLIPNLTSAKAQALLYYLAMTGREYTRAALASLLWGGHGEEEARGNLRKAIQQLREQLNEHLTIERETIQLRAEPVYWVDTLEFVAQLSQERTAQEPERLHQAVALYQGDFLEGFYVRAAPEFEAWMLTERARLRELLLQALETLAERYASGGDLSQAITTARRLLELEPWREEVHRQLMEWLAQNGQRSAALAQYELCCRALAEELAVEPAQATRETYERLQRQGNVAQATPPPPLPAIDYVLVGRRQEWQTLRAVWQQVVQGGVHCVCIAGEAGIGKTRLAEELLVSAQRQGYAMARARTYALEDRLAYAPLADWLRSDALRTQLAKLDGVWLSEVARLLPELLVEESNLPPPQPLTDRWQQKHLFEALVRAFTREPRPLLLLLDDLQWCDPETLEWLQYLFGAAPQAKLLVVGTVRAEEVEDDHPLHNLRRQLLREGKITTIELAPLTAAETAALGAQVAQHDLDTTSAGQLYQQSEGNPLFVIESVRAGMSDWSQKIQESAPISTLPSPRSNLQSPRSNVRSLPPKVVAVIQSRLAQLSADAHALAHLAATIGRAFSIELLVQAGVKDEATILRSLDELWRRRIVRELEIGSYDFSHDRIREVAYAEQSPIRRLQLHRQTAQSLERLYAANLDMVSGQVAAHYELAGAVAQAVTYYQQAASAARRIFANREATHYLQKGLALLKSQPDTPARQQQELEMQIELASVLMDTLGWASPEPERAYLRALELCQQLKETVHLFPTLWGLHEVYLFQAKHEQARAMAEQCLEFAQRTQDPALLIQAHHAMWGVLGLLSPYEIEGALAHAEAGIALYDPQQHHRQAFHYGGHDPGICALMFAAGHWWLLGYPDQAHRRVQEVVRLGYQLNHPFSLAIALLNGAGIYVRRREFDTVLSFAQTAFTIATEQDIPLLLAQAKATQGWALTMLGDIEQGLILLQNGITEWRSLGIVLRQTLYLVRLAEAYGKAGHFDAALNTLDEAQATAYANSEQIFDAEIHHLRGELFLATGRPAENAETAFQQALAVARRQKAKSLELRAATSLARLWQQQGRISEAYQLLAEVYNWFTEGFDTVDLREAKALLDELVDHPANRNLLDIGAQVYELQNNSAGG